MRRGTAGSIPPVHGVLTLRAAARPAARPAAGAL